MTDELAPIDEQVFWHLGPEYHEWMQAQGIAIAPTARVVSEGAGNRSADRQSLILATPASNIAYQLHPGVPEERQRIKIGGYVNDGILWAEVRLIKDGDVVAVQEMANRIEAWWTLTPGEHRFWLEGRPSTTDEVLRSDEALVVVEEHESDLVQSTP